MEKLKSFSPVLLRIGLALIFLWFGTNQFTHTNDWLGFVPDSIANLSHLSTTTLVHLNGAFEIIFGAALLLGIFTRFVSFLLALHLLDIMFIVGLNALGVRDFGLTIATFAVWMHGRDFLTLDSYIAKEKAEHSNSSQI